MITSGHKSDVKWGDGNWVFFDVGFSNSAKSCGLLIGDGEPICTLYGDAKKHVLEYIQQTKTPVKLVIEAPLSVCFDEHGNPKGRKIEKQGSSTRYWYAGLGCCVTTAAAYLVQEILKTNAEVILFEGFVTFKQAGIRLSHADEVMRLRNAVKSAGVGALIYDEEGLRTDPRDRLISAFSLHGHDLGIPAVIRA